MATTYGLVSFSAGSGPETAGIIIDGRITPIGTIAVIAGAHGAWMGHASVLNLLERWSDASDILTNVVNGGDARLRADAIDAGEVELQPPVRARQIFCTGANYKKHVVDLTMDMNVGPEGLSGDGLRRWAEEMMDERLRTGQPYAFTKPISVLAGANKPLRVPPTTEKLDWEAELCVVIGAGGYMISRDNARAHIAGYCVANDISARDLIPRTDYKMLGTDWLRSKAQPGFLPLGPWITPAQFVPDPYALRITLSLNGEVMQNEFASDMLFNIERQIEYISRYVELMPGDLICTGSPSGNGTHYNRFLRAGDVMVAEITGLGAQRVECVAHNG